jgi:hypothetical protein
VTTNEAYSKIADCLLALKAKGATSEQLAEAIVRAASQSNVQRHEIAEAYETLML